MSPADVIGSGAYVPRTGDRVTVRRYIAPATGERALDSEYTGTVVEAVPHADGWFITLNNHPDRIFTGYQFLGAGASGQGPASLVTEVTRAEPAAGTFARQLTPDMAVAVDGSGCIVLVVTEPRGKLLRVITVTDVEAFKAALDDARTAQHAALGEAGAPRVAGPNEKRRSEGRLIKSEAKAGRRTATANTGQPAR